MRHQKKSIKLGRVRGPRIALLRSLAEGLVLHGSITTTKAKAKAVRQVVEPLVTKAKQNRPTAREQVSKVLYTGKAIKKLFTEIAPRYAERNGGYTRITKLGTRTTDSADMAKIEFV